MKLPDTNSRAERRERALRGQILAEAAIGLSLMAFVWILVSYVNYMCINRIRTNMAARYSAWLSGNGVDPTANKGAIITTNFFIGNDVNLAVICPSVKNSLSLAGFPLPTTISSIIDANLCSNSVTFGINFTAVSASSPFPFNMLEVKVPFMPTELLTNFTMVSGHCAWPDNVSDTYSGLWPFSGGSPVLTALAGYETMVWYAPNVF